MKNFGSKHCLLGGLLTAALIMTGCGDSDNFVFTNTAPVVVPAPPVAVNDNYNALGNATLNQSVVNGVLINDTINGATITAFDAVASNGGAVVLNADGSFTYTPVPGFVGAETFTYTLTNADGSSTATVTLTSTGLGLFVDNSVAVNGTGTQADPFDNLADAVAAAQAGDTIFVARGDGTNNNLAGAVNLPQGVDLVGEGTGLILSQTIVPQGQAPVLTGPVTCNGDNTVQGILFDGGGATGDGIVATTVADVTVANNTFRNYTDNYVDFDDVSGTNTVNGNTFDPGDNEDYVDFDNLDTNCTFIVTNNTFSDDNTSDPASDGMELDVEGTSVITFTMTGNTFMGDNVANTFDEAVEIDCDGTSALTFTMDNNVIDTVQDDGIDLSTNDTSTANGSVSGNMVSNVGDEGVELEPNGGTTTVDGNTITNSAQDGLDLDFNLGGTIIVTNNTITGSGEEAIEYEDSTATNPALVAIRNNTLTGNTNFCLQIVLQGNPSVCLDITGNTVDQDMEFDDTSTGTISVEQFAQLGTINTVQGGFMAVEVNDAVVDVAAGFCGIP